MQQWIHNFSTIFSDYRPLYSFPQLWNFLGIWVFPQCSHTCSLFLSTGSKVFTHDPNETVVWGKMPTYSKDRVLILAAASAHAGKGEDNFFCRISWFPRKICCTLAKMYCQPILSLHMYSSYWQYLTHNRTFSEFLLQNLYRTSALSRCVLHFTRDNQLYLVSEASES